MENMSPADEPEKHEMEAEHIISIKNEVVQDGGDTYL